jgi:hypothetical protein
MMRIDLAIKLTAGAILIGVVLVVVQMAIH